jgi:hypothetical protein
MARRATGPTGPTGPAVLAALLSLGGGLAACDGDPEGAPPSPTPAAVRPAWTEVALPVPPGATSRRLVVRDAVECGGRWYVVGAVAGAGDATAPAAWSSPDARTWTPLRMRPKTYYGIRNVLYSAACANGRLAAIGGKVGGAHGNPRVSSWRQLPDGSLDEVIAAFTLYGGPHAVNVARLTAGPAGFLIVGNRTSGAAVWTSPDGAEFTIHEGTPGLASDPGTETWLFDAVAMPGGWLAAGGEIRKGHIERDPLAWTSPDGRRWTREKVGYTDEYEELQRVVRGADGDAVAVGLRHRAFGAWRREGDRWAAAARFGAASDKGVPMVRGLVATASGLLAATGSGGAHALWRSVDGGRTWGPVRLPVPVPTGAGRDVAIATGPAGILLLTDDGRAGRAWLAPLPGA